MSEYRFTDGNLLVLYAIHKASSGDGLPEYIKERVRLGLETYNMIMKSKADKHKTMVMIIGRQGPAEQAKKMLMEGGVKQDIIAIDSDSQNMGQTIDRIYDQLKNKPNPPFIYFIGSVWLHDIFNATVVSKMKNWRVQFYGALDHRPVAEVDAERALDAPKKGSEYYKQKIKNKAVDTLLNIIFPD